MPGSQEIFCTLVRIVGVLIFIIPTFLFCLLKIIFQSSQNFLRRHACEILIFSSICQCVSVNFIFLFYVLKIIFQNSQNFLKRNACEIIIFPQFVKEIEELKLSLLKQHNEMLKTKPEMLLKIRKKWQINPD